MIAKRLGRLALLVAMLGGVVAGSATPASASCIAPMLQVHPAILTPGEQVTITGQGFMSECRDTIIPSTSQPLPPVAPYRGIALWFDQAGSRTQLATVDATARFTFSAIVRVPLDARPGTATIVARIASIDFGRVDASVSAGPPELAHTGPGLGLGIAGAVLLAVGGGLVLARRRRTSARPVA